MQIEDEGEIRALYVWWTKIRPLEKKRHEEMLPEDWYLRKDEPDVADAFKRWMDEDDRLVAKDDEMLMRLMKVRGRLWT